MQDQERRDRLQHLVRLHGRRVDHGAQAAGQVAEDANAHRREYHEDKEIGRHGEGRARFLDPAQVDDHDHEDQPHRQVHPVGVQGGERRGDLRHARGDRHGHGEDVVGQQRGACGLRGQLAQVVAGHDVGAAAARIGVNGLLVRHGDDQQQGGDGDRDREHVAEGQAAAGRQDDQDLLRGVGRRRQRIRGENRQPDQLADGLVRRIGRRQRASDERGAPGPLRLIVRQAVHHTGPVSVIEFFRCVHPDWLRPA